MLNTHDSVAKVLGGVLGVNLEWVDDVLVDLLDDVLDGLGADQVVDWVADEGLWLAIGADVLVRLVDSLAQVLEELLELSVLLLEEGGHGWTILLSEVLNVSVEVILDPSGDLLLLLLDEANKLIDEEVLGELLEDHVEEVADAVDD